MASDIHNHNTGPGFATSLLAGGFSGTVVDVSLYPIDTLKTRLQSAQGFAAAGGFRGVYSGIGSALAGSAPSAALFFITYEWIKCCFTDAQSNCGKTMNITRFEPLHHMIAATCGEVAACAVRVPTEVIKQRAQASQSSSSLAVLRNILAKRHSLGNSAIYRELYRGGAITVLREIPFTLIQFPLWESLKKNRNIKTGKPFSTATESAFFGCISGAVAAFATTPLDVLKTRMMLAQTKQKFIPLAKQILAERGPSIFFSGVVPRVIWISTGGAIFLGSYQLGLNQLTGSI